MGDGVEASFLLWHTKTGGVGVIPGPSPAKTPSWQEDRYNHGGFCLGATHKLVLEPAQKIRQLDNRTLSQRGGGGKLKYQTNIVNHAIAEVTALDMHWLEMQVWCISRLLGQLQIQPCFPEKGKHFISPSTDDALVWWYLYKFILTTWGLLDRSTTRYFYKRLKTSLHKSTGNS